MELRERRNIKVPPYYTSDDASEKQNDQSDSSFTHELFVRAENVLCWKCRLLFFEVLIVEGIHVQSGRGRESSIDAQRAADLHKVNFFGFGDSQVLC